MVRVTADAMKAAVASYWRYQRQYPVVAFEASDHWAGELADILVLDHWPPLTPETHLIEIEVKISLADLRRDKDKHKHRHFRNGTSKLVSYFYFAVPVEIGNTVALLCDNLYPYAGVLGTTGTGGSGVQVYRSAKRFFARPLREEDIRLINRDQSATLCRLAKKVVELKNHKLDSDPELNTVLSYHL
jgi:hypothetical protein